MTDVSEPSAVRARISVSGRVQGVGYRAFTVRTASERGLVGGVRNCEDGRVELEAEGAKEKIMSLIEALKIGPRGNAHSLASPFRSRSSHALATIHCRFTVAGEMPIASPVSSIVNPPKYRSSTNRPCSG